VTVSAFHTTRCLWTQSFPESGEKFESGTELESEPGGEVRLREEREAPTVDLVVAENLPIFPTNVNVHHKGSNLLHCPFVWLSIQLHPLRGRGRRR